MKTNLVELRTKNGWYIAIISRPRGAGRAIRKWLGTRDEAEARQKVKDGKLEEIARADAADALVKEVWTRMIAGKNIRVRDSIEQFKEHRVVTGMTSHGIDHEQRFLNQFLLAVCEQTKTDFGNASIAALQPKHISDFVNAPSEIKLSTRAQRLNWLKSWLQWNVEKRWIVVNPAAHVCVRLDSLTQDQLLSKSKEPFTDEEVKRLLAIIPRTDFWHGAVLLGYTYGLRLISVATLEETNVVGNMLRVYTTKGRREVNEPLTDELTAWLAEWQKVREVSTLPYLFPAQATAYQTRPAFLTDQFRSLRDKAGLPGKTFHGLRRTAAERRWNAELEELGPEEKRKLTQMVASKGFRRVQELLAHQPGSSVTAQHYMPTAP